MGKKKDFPSRARAHRQSVIYRSFHKKWATKFSYPFFIYIQNSLRKSN